MINRNWYNILENVNNTLDNNWEWTIKIEHDVFISLLVYLINIISFWIRFEMCRKKEKKKDHTL